MQLQSDDCTTDYEMSRLQAENNLCKFRSVIYRGRVDFFEKKNFSYSSSILCLTVAAEAGKERRPYKKILSFYNARVSERVDS